MSFGLLMSCQKLNHNNVGKPLPGNMELQMAGESTREDSASAACPTIEKADGRHKRDLFG
jgi:hypothetical protein